jgi:hypothetical protein
MASKIRMTRGALYRCEVGDIDLLHFDEDTLVDAKRTTAKLWTDQSGERAGLSQNKKRPALNAEIGRAAPIPKRNDTIPRYCPSIWT